MSGTRDGYLFSLLLFKIQPEFLAQSNKTRERNGRDTIRRGRSQIFPIFK
jgi:hypothetical protein